MVVVCMVLMMGSLHFPLHFVPQMCPFGGKLEGIRPLSVCFAFIVGTNGHLLEVIIEEEVDVRVAARLDALSKVLLVQCNRFECAADVHSKATHQALAIKAVCQLFQLCVQQETFLFSLLFDVRGNKNKRRARTSQRQEPWLSAHLRIGGNPSVQSALRCGTRQGPVVIVQKA